MKCARCQQEIVGVPAALFVGSDGIQELGIWIKRPVADRPYCSIACYQDAGGSRLTSERSPNQTEFPLSSPSLGNHADDTPEPDMDIEGALRTLEHRSQSDLDTGNYVANRIDHVVIPLLRRILRAVELPDHGKPHVRFAFFFIPEDQPIMVTITAPDVTTGQTLQFGLVGSTPAGGSFVEPTVVPTAGAGTVALQPSVPAASADPTTGATAFTTAGVFTPTAGFTGPVTLSAEVQGVDDQDCTFNVVAIPAPESVSFDPSKFAVV